MRWHRLVVPSRPWQHSRSVFPRLSKPVGALEARVRVDGIYLGDEVAVATDPERDEQAFAIFQHGLRRVIFLPGVEREELGALAKVLATDPKSLDPREDDLITLLGAEEMVSLHFVVVETFIEGEEDAEAEVQDVIAAGLSERCLGYDGEEDAALTSVRLWEADQRLLESDELARLDASLPKGTAGGTEGELDAELDALRSRLLEGIERSGVWLAHPATHLAGVLSDEERARLTRVVAHQLVHDARTREPRDASESLAEALKLRDEQARITGDAERAGLVFAGALEELAIDVLRGGAEGSEALEVFAGLPRESRAGLLLRVAELTKGAARNAALASLATPDDAGVAQARKVWEKLDEGGALALTHGLRACPASPAAIAFFRERLVDPRPRFRARAMVWFEYAAPDHAVAILGDALRKGSPEDRLCALHILLRSRSTLARTLILALLQSKEFSSCEFESKRLTMLAFAEVAGGSALPYLRSKAEEMALRAPSRDTRAAAVAALGVLARARAEDEESRSLLEELAGSRGVGRLVTEEANRALEAFTTGSPAYAVASVLIETELRARSLLDELMASSASGSGRAPVDARRPRSKPASLVPGFAVASSTLAGPVSSGPPSPLSSVPAPDSATLAASDALRAPRMPVVDISVIDGGSSISEETSPATPRAGRRSPRSARTLVQPSAQAQSVAPSTTPKPASLRPPTAGGEERLGSRRPRRPSARPASRSPVPELPATPRERPSLPVESAPLPSQPPENLAALLEAYVTERPPAKAGDDE